MASSVPKSPWQHGTPRYSFLASASFVHHGSKCYLALRYLPTVQVEWTGSFHLAMLILLDLGRSTLMDNCFPFAFSLALIPLRMIRVLLMYVQRCICFSYSVQYDSSWSIFRTLQMLKFAPIKLITFLGVGNDGPNIKADLMQAFRRKDRKYRKSTAGSRGSSGRKRCIFYT